MGVCLKGEWRAVWLSGAAALCSFSSLAEAPCSLSSKLKATRDGERKGWGTETGSLWHSLVSKMLSLFSLLHTFLSVCARARFCVQRRVSDCTHHCCVPSLQCDTAGAIWAYERKKPRKQLYLCMRVRIGDSNLKPAVSPHRSCGLWCSHKQAGTDLWHPHMTA